MDASQKKRVLFVCGLMVVALSLVSIRLVYVQYVQHEHYLAEAEAYYLHQEELPASRGRIVDRNGELLARNQTVYTLIADANHLADSGIACAGLARAEGVSASEVRRKYSRAEIRERYIRELARVLAPELGLKEQEMRDTLLNKPRGEIVIANGVEEEGRRRLQEIMSETRLRGVYFRQKMQRFYPSPDCLTQVLGYTNVDGVGQEGIEKVFDEVMRGEPGFRYLERDRRGREIVVFRGDTKQPTSGDNVRLTIDMGLQTLVEKVVDDVFQEREPRKASAIVMDPNTGEILAMASRPHFNLITREGVRRNIALSDVYEPGSTFKVVAYAGALEQRLVAPDTTIHCHWGSMREGKIVINDHHPYGDLTCNQIIAKSSNIGVYKIARLLNSTRFVEKMKAFGFGEPTRLAATAEASGVVHPKERWSATSFSRMSMGYEVNVTPLQMLNAYAAIANGGELMRPRLVQSIEDHRGRVVERFPRETIRRVVSERTAALVREAMVGVIDEKGTGSRAAIPGYTVAGKTGTSRRFSEELGRYEPGHYVTSFVGFLPAEDPQLAAIVVIDDPTIRLEPDEKFYGGTVAAPVFARLAGEAAHYLNIRPTRDGSQLVTSNGREDR